jgi:hypothetical protein
VAPVRDRHQGPALKPDARYLPSQVRIRQGSGHLQCDSWGPVRKTLPSELCATCRFGWLLLTGRVNENRKTSSLTERKTKMCRFSTYLASGRPPTWGSVSLLIDLASGLSHRSGQFLSSARTASAGRSDSLGAVLVRGHKMHTGAANPVTELRRSLPVAERMSAHRAPRGDRLLSFVHVPVARHGAQSAGGRTEAIR